MCESYLILRCYTNIIVLTRQVFELSIGAACRLTWPSDRLIVQVLDDSTDPAIMVRS